MDDLRAEFNGRGEISGVENRDADFVDARSGAGCVFNVDAEEYGALFGRSVCAGGWEETETWRPLALKFLYSAILRSSILSGG